MKLKNKKTGEIGYPYFQNWKEITCVIVDENAIQIAEYTSLAELNEEWEDVSEEPFSTSFYTIVDGEIKHCIFYKERVAGCPDDAWAYIKDDGRECIKQLKEVGLYFETREEAEKAVEKLKAWKMLKDMGFKIEGIRYRNHKNYIEWSISQKVRDDHFTAEGFNNALHLIFGGEE